MNNNIEALIPFIAMTDSEMIARRAIKQRSTVILSSILTMAHAKLKLCTMKVSYVKDNGN